MAERVVKMPDIGEGITEAEISEWLVAVGDLVAEDDGLVEVLTDKATVEIPASVSGRVTWRAGEPGDRLAVGAPLLKIEVEGDEALASEPESAPEPEYAAKPDAAEPPEPEDIEIPEAEPEREGAPDDDRGDKRPRPSGRRRGRGERVLAAPAVRARAADLGLDLAEIAGTGPGGRVTHSDLDRRLRAAPMAERTGTDEITETRIIGLRRRIAEQMALSHARIVPITIVEEVDVTEVERLRAQMNAERGEDRAKLTLLP